MRVYSLKKSKSNIEFLKLYTTFTMATVLVFFLVYH